VCRLFGFRSIIPSQVHRSLLAADNALCTQSERHPDGWGVAYYIDGAPHLTRAASTALHDHLFHRLSGIVSSETVVAHIRRATVGGRSVLNSHPFQYGRWIFAHNGDVPEFDRCRARLHAEIAPALRRFILGETDSEVMFFLFLSILSRAGALASDFEIEVVVAALRETMRLARELVDGPDAPSKAKLTFLLTNGRTLIATHGGRELFWSSYKTRCRDRDSCKHLAAECENPSESGSINHLIVASEPLGGDNVWLPLSEGEVIGVDGRMRLLRRSLADASQPALDASNTPGSADELVRLGSVRQS
jgi:glutamine amidotransferase